MNILSYLMRVGLSPTLMESRRLLMQNAIKIDGVTIKDSAHNVPLNGKTLTVWKGKYVGLLCEGVKTIADWNTGLNAWVYREEPLSGKGDS